MTYQLSSRSKERRAGIDRRLIEIDDLAITLTKLDYGHPKDSGLRTAVRQNELYNTTNDEGERLSQCDGYNDISEHQKGNALDYYAYVDGKASWDPLHLAMVAAAYLQAASILGHKLEWGGLFGRQDGKPGWDMPHIQLKD